VIDTIIIPARAEGQGQARVRAGDLDKALGYGYRRLPLICSALTAQKFCVAARVKLREVTGPPSRKSTTTTFLFEVEPTSQHGATTNPAEVNRLRNCERSSTSFPTCPRSSAGMAGVFSRSLRINASGCPSAENE
jgi:hypothetical protein